MQYPLISHRFYIALIPAAKPKPLTNTYLSTLSKHTNDEVRVIWAVKNNLKLTWVIKLTPRFNRCGSGRVIGQCKIHISLNEVLQSACFSSLFLPTLKGKRKPITEANLREAQTFHIFKVISWKQESKRQTDCQCSDYSAKSSHGTARVLATMQYFPPSLST